MIKNPGSPRRVSLLANKTTRYSTCPQCFKDLQREATNVVAHRSVTCANKYMYLHKDCFATWQKKITKSHAETVDSVEKFFSSQFKD